GWASGRSVGRRSRGCSGGRSGLAAGWDLDQLRDGKPDAEAGSRAGVTFDIDTTPVLCDDPMARGQAEAHPFPRRLGREKGIENAGKDRLRDSRPVVANLDHDVTAAGPGLN